MSRCQGNRGVSFQKCQIALLSSHFSDNPVSLFLPPPPPPSTPATSPLLTAPLPRGNHGLRFIPITLPMQGPLFGLCCLGRCRLILDGEEEEGSVCADSAGMEGEMVPSCPRCCISYLGVVAPGCQGLYRAPRCPPKNKGTRVAPLSWDLHKGPSLLRASHSISTAGCPAGGHGSISACPMDTCSTAPPPPHSVPLDGGSSNPPPCAARAARGGTWRKCGYWRKILEESKEEHLCTGKLLA